MTQLSTTFAKLGSMRLKIWRFTTSRHYYRLMPFLWWKVVRKKRLRNSTTHVWQAILQSWVWIQAKSMTGRIYHLGRTLPKWGIREGASAASRQQSFSKSPELSYDSTQLGWFCTQIRNTSKKNHQKLLFDFVFPPLWIINSVSSTPTPSNSLVIKQYALLQSENFLFYAHDCCEGFWDIFLQPRDLDYEWYRKFHSFRQTLLLQSNSCKAKKIHWPGWAGWWLRQL